MRGDPESPLTWTTKSVRHLAGELRRQGHQVSLRLVARGVTTRYSRVRFIVATTGASVPLLARRFCAGFSRSDPARYAELGGAINPLRTLYYDTSIVEEPLKHLSAREELGADRLVLGSDPPRIKPEEAGAYFGNSPHLSDDEKRAILHHNAQSVLGLRNN